MQTVSECRRRAGASTLPRQNETLMWSAQPCVWSTPWVIDLNGAGHVFKVATLSLMLRKLDRGHPSQLKQDKFESVSLENGVSTMIHGTFSDKLAFPNRSEHMSLHLNDML